MRGYNRVNEAIKPENTIEKKISNLMLSFIFVIIISFLLRDSFGINIPSILFYIIFTIGFLFLDRKELLPFFMFLIPLSNGPFLYYINFVFGFFFILKNLKYIKINKPVAIAFMLLFWEILHFLPNALMGYEENIIKFLGFGLILIVTSMVISNTDLSIEYRSILYSWTIGFISFVTILLIKYSYHFGISNFSAVVRRFGWIPADLNVVTTSLLINPNALCKLVILTVFSLLTLLKYNKEKSTILFFSIIYISIFSLLSGSRSALLILSILFLIYIIELLFSF